MFQDNRVQFLHTIIFIIIQIYYYLIIVIYIVMVILWTWTKIFFDKITLIPSSENIIDINIISPNLLFE